MKANVKAVSPPRDGAGKKGLAGTLLYMRQHWQLYIILSLCCLP